MVTLLTFRENELYCVNLKSERLSDMLKSNDNNDNYAFVYNINFSAERNQSRLPVYLTERTNEYENVGEVLICLSGHHT